MSTHATFDFTALINAGVCVCLLDELIILIIMIVFLLLVAAASLPVSIPRDADSRTTPCALAVTSLGRVARPCHVRGAHRARRKRRPGTVGLSALTM